MLWMGSKDKKMIERPMVDDAATDLADEDEETPTVV